MKFVGKSKTEFVSAPVGDPGLCVSGGAPVLVVEGANTTTGAGLYVPKSAMAPTLIVPDHIAEARAEEEARPWTTIEALYQELRSAKTESRRPISRGKFRSQLRKMINRGLVEIKYPTKREHEYGAQKMVRPTKVGRKAAADVVSS